MNYKRIGLLSCAGMLAVTFLLPLCLEKESTRYHQHLSAPTVPVSAEEESGSGTFSTHLPLIEIDTGGVKIPGRPILQDGIRVGYETTADGSNDILAHLSFVDTPHQMHCPGDLPTVKSDALIHIRGHSSRFFDKPSYAIRLQKSNGENNPQRLLGMDSHHEWVLHGPYLDKTLLQNYMWYNIAGELMDYAPNVRFCEVMLDGVYQGVYVLTERITAGKHCRLPLSASKKHNNFTGYLLRLDRGSSIEEQNIESFTSYTGRANTILNIEYPGMKNLTPTLRDSICRDFSRFEKSLYSFDYRDDTYGYLSQIDVDSFIDYFLLNELTCNYDAGSLSTYIYRDIDGIFRMCVWDFNNACDNYQQGSMVEPQQFVLQNRLWFEMLMKDPEFTDRVISRYRALRESFFSDEYLENYMDGVVEYLGPAIERNYQVWGYSFSPAYDLLIPSERNPRSYEEAVDNVKNFLRQRTAWMDKNIETLRQYSADSSTKTNQANVN